MEISRIKVSKMNRMLFLSQRCKAPFWKCTRDIKGGLRYIIDTIIMYRRASDPHESSSSPMHLPQVGSSDKANDQVSVCKHSDISHARVRRNYPLGKLHGSTQPL